MPRFLNLLMIMSFVTSLSACNLLQRHPSSGYSDYGSHGGLDFFQKQDNYERSMAKAEIENERGHSLSEEEMPAIQNRLSLKGLESRLTTETEKKQYYQYKPYLTSDRERMFFLQLPSTQARERYANNRGIASLRSAFAPKHTDLIENKDITVGMNQKAVTESWGEPDIVEVAGNPVYGNQRWKYSKYVSSESGYTRQTRFVYFENGIVTGWESF